MLSISSSLPGAVLFKCSPRFTAFSEYSMREFVLVDNHKNGQKRSRNATTVPQSQTTVFNLNLIPGRFFFCQSRKDLDSFASKRDLQMTSAIKNIQSVAHLKNFIEINERYMNVIHVVSLLSLINGKLSNNLAVQTISECVLRLWDKNFSFPHEQNSRAIATIIFRASQRSVCKQILAQKILTVDYLALCQYINQSEFVMMTSGLAKMEILSEIEEKSHKSQSESGFSFERLIIEMLEGRLKDIDSSRLVFLWYNILKSGAKNKKIKQSVELNDCFAEKLKNSSFEDNVVDYAQMVFCYVHSKPFRTVELMFPIISFPKKNAKGTRKTEITTGDLSLLCQNLSIINKEHNASIYVPQQLVELIKEIYLTKMKEIVEASSSKFQMRNVANPFNALIQLTDGDISEQIYVRTCLVYLRLIMDQKNRMQKIKNSEISLEEKANQNGKAFRKKQTSLNSIDELSLVSLFNQILHHHKAQYEMLHELFEESVQFIQLKYCQEKYRNELIDEKVLVKLICGFSTARKKFIEQLDYLKQRGSLQQDTPEFKIPEDVSRLFVDQVCLRKQYRDPKNLSFILSYLNILKIYSQKVCLQSKDIITGQYSQSQQAKFFGQRLSQKCLMDRNSKKCLGCLKNN